MKPLVLVSLIFFLLGGFLGAVIPHLIEGGSGQSAPIQFEDTEGKEDAEYLNSLEELEKEKASLLTKIEEFEGQLNQLRQQHLEEVPQLESTEAELRKLKKDWIASALETTDPRSSRRNQRELSRMIELLGLTPEQANEMSLLYEKRSQKQRLDMMRMMGLIDEQEYASLFAELDAFDFEMASELILSEQQKEQLHSIEEERRTAGIQRVSEMMADRLNVEEEGRFSTTQQEAIHQAIQSAMDRDANLDIPPAIQELQINRMDKRILAAGFEQLDTDAFEKLYESIVERNESGDAFFRRGGPRGGRPPAD